MAHYELPNRWHWIRRRARRIMRFYKVSRTMAVHDALQDYADFHGKLTLKQVAQ